LNAFTPKLQVTLEIEMKRILPLLLILLTGCATAPKYNYQSQSGTDPQFIFGDRFGGGSVNSPARSFKINTTDAALNKCTDFAIVGTTSNHWMHVVPKTVEIKAPAGKSVSISSGYNYSNGFSNTTCAPPTLMFSPQEGTVYSVDIETVGGKCALSIVRKLPDGKQEPVSGITVLPACKS
jgi:hypothetical protein